MSDFFREIIALKDRCMAVSYIPLVSVEVCMKVRREFQEVEKELKKIVEENDLNLSKFGHVQVMIDQALTELNDRQGKIELRENISAEITDLLQTNGFTLDNDDLEMCIFRLKAVLPNVIKLNEMYKMSDEDHARMLIRNIRSLIEAYEDHLKNRLKNEYD